MATPPVRVEGRDVDLQTAIDLLMTQIRDLKGENETLRQDRMNNTANTSQGSESVTATMYVRNFSLIPSIPVFQGRAEDSVNTFFTKLEQSAELCGWTDSEKLAIAKLRVSGEAQDFTLSHSECREATTYEALKQELVKRFKRKNTTRYYREQLTRIKLSSDESVEQFADRIRKINVNTYDLGDSEEGNAAIKFEADQRALDAFLNGLSGDLGRLTRLSKPKLFQDAIESAVDIVEVDRRPVDDRRTEKRVFTYYNEIKCHKCRRYGHLAKICPINKLVCFHCQAKGHISKFCRKRYEGKKPPPNDQGIGPSHDPQSK